MARSYKYPKAEINWEGWRQSPLPDDLAGPAPVACLIDCPTIDKRFSQIVFQGYTQRAVIDNNDPKVVHVGTWLDLPMMRHKRGYQYSGMQGWAPPVEYDVPRPWMEPVAIGKYHARRDYTGFQLASVRPNGEPPRLGGTVTEVPMSSRLFNLRRQPLFMGVTLPEIMPTTVASLSYNWLPLVGVGAGITGLPIVAGYYMTGEDGVFLLAENGDYIIAEV